MVIYTKIKTSTGTKYRKDNLFVKPDRIPADVVEKFEFTDSVKYDDEPDKARCIFCEAPSSHQRMVNPVAHEVGLMIVELCDHHYYNANLGTIVHQISLSKERENHGINAKVSKRSSTKRLQRASR
jgi:hypothetical protein